MCGYEGTEALVGQKRGPRVLCAELQVKENVGLMTSHLALLARAVYAQNHADSEQPKEQFVTERQVCMRLLSRDLSPTPAAALVMQLQYICGICVWKEGEGGSYFIEGATSPRAPAFQVQQLVWGKGSFWNARCIRYARDVLRRKRNKRQIPRFVLQLRARPSAWRAGPGEAGKEGLKFIPSVTLHCLNFLPIVLIPSALTVVVCLPVLPLQGWMGAI